jgi:hypothetical protein
MAAKGRKVPSLDTKPEFPDYLAIALQAHGDLTKEGSVDFSEYCLWWDRVGLKSEAQFWHIWDLLKTAHFKVYEWQQQERERSSPTNSGKTTAPSSGRTGRSPSH